MLDRWIDTNCLVKLQHVSLVNLSQEQIGFDNKNLILLDILFLCHLGTNIDSWVRRELKTNVAKAELTSHKSVFVMTCQ